MKSNGLVETWRRLVSAALRMAKNLKDRKRGNPDGRTRKQRVSILIKPYVDPNGSSHNQMKKKGNGMS